MNAFNRTKAVAYRRMTLNVVACVATCLCGGFTSGVLHAATAATAESNGEASDMIDPLYTQPYVDIDEWRDQPVHHRYVHGGFKDTDARFSMYFPPKELYQRRFYQPLMPISGNENAAQAPTSPNIGFAVDSGAYLVESNLGRLDMFPGSDPTIAGYRTSAAVAKYSRVLAAQMYGKHRPYGYVYGGSGGAFKTISCVESTIGVWDGSVPFVHASPMSLPSAFTVKAHAMRILWDKFPQIIDATEPGGSGDIYAGLNAEEKDALTEVTRMGFSPRAWFDYKRIAFDYTGVFSTLVDNIVKWDPSYFDDFWKVPGYLGANPTKSLLQARIQHKTKIGKLLLADDARTLGLPLSQAAGQNNNSSVPAALQAASLPSGDLQGATVIVTSGKAAGHVFSIAGVVKGYVMIGFGEDNFRSLQALQVGDDIQIDNSIYLAVQTYHRHQVPTPDYYVWDQYRGPDGKPLYPQRPVLLGPKYAEMGSGSVQSGKIHGKMIVIETLMDEGAFPWKADWYRTKVQAALGSRFDDNYRLYFVDHAMHVSPVVAKDAPRPVSTTRIVSYTGQLQQALRDLSAWVERGVPPPASTPYKVVDGQVLVPDKAGERKGTQPVVTATANGATRVDVKVGETVQFAGIIDVPPGTGSVVGAEWDFEGAGDYPVAEKFNGANSSPLATVKASYAFSKAGTYFPTLRATSQREGNATTPYARVQNLDRVRVVVK
jgi:hypothetical protein